MNKNIYKKYKRSGTFYRNVKNKRDEYKKFLETALRGENTNRKYTPEKKPKQPEVESSPSSSGHEIASKSSESSTSLAEELFEPETSINSDVIGSFETNKQSISTLHIVH
ncbi:uncharacterized protein LOC129729361 [Wyeomyia smithii]|uniref:uncharacterized protein LOC129729361 n=1 Tax=Wyeomyia smithii TaxID=174621 RepID=UPI002467D28A|nr:uncharacterized protein LOC129729361 [Wyeomyia smithii]